MNQDLLFEKPISPRRLRTSLALAWVFSALFFAAAAAEESVASIETVKPERRDVVRWINIPGNTEALVELPLYARASGFLCDFKLDIGDSVKPGQPIGRIDAPELEQDVKLAEAQLASAKADVKAAEAAVLAADAAVKKVQASSTEIDAKEMNLKSDIVKAKAEKDKAQKQYDRTKKLFDTEAATDQDRENQEYTVKVYEAGIEVAQTHLAAIPSERAVLAQELESAKAAVEVAKSAVAAAKGKEGIAEAALKRAKVWFDYTNVVVPVLGLGTPIKEARVIKRFVSNGDMITAGMGGRSGMQALVQVVVSDPIRVCADVPEPDAPNVGMGSQVSVTFYGMKSEAPIKGKITLLAPSLSAATRSLHVEMEVPNPTGALRAGMMANVEIATDVHKGTWAIPATAVVSGKQGSTSIFIAETGKAKKINVQPGYLDHEWEEVTAKELNENTIVVKNARKSGVVDGAEIPVLHN
ncbi:MAG TPA: efflux RND transporter periplasmic adaptor subunit [Planctomycetota bacterium]|nr:efflux RND transporter periplasmic adaptor subunit [Planctomycetota bacterium]